MPAAADSMPRDRAARLSVELFHRVLDNLRQPDVLRAAQVSRRWRSFSVLHRFYYAASSFSSPTSAPWSTCVDFRASKFCQTLRRCKQRGVRLALDIEIDPSDSDFGWWILDGIFDGIVQRDYSWLGAEPFRHPVIERVLPALADVLSLVFKLRIRANPRGDYTEPVYSALLGAAPLLEHLELDLSAPWGRFEMDSPSPPVDLFACNAPRLRTVMLCNTALPDTPVPALLLADDVDLQFISQPTLSRIMTCFPGAINLRICCGSPIIDIPDSPGPVASFGAVLERLELHVGPDEEYPEDLRAALERECIPHVELGICRRAPEICPVLDHLPEYLSLALQANPDDDSGPTDEGRMVLMQADMESPTPFTRAFAFRDQELEQPLLNPQLSQLSQRLVRVEIAHKYLDVFVHTLDSLPELTSLTVDVTFCVFFWLAGYMFQSQHIKPLFPGGPEAQQGVEDLPLDAIYEACSECTLDCPALTRFNLRGAGDSPVVVNTVDLLHLARDLSLLRDQDTPSVTLGLEGVTLEGPQYIGLFCIFTNYE